MRSRLLRFFLVGVLLSAAGVHVALLQGVAWAKMVASYSSHETLRTSVVKTFDGRHPCSLCLEIKKTLPAGPSLTTSPSKSQGDGALLMATFFFPPADSSAIPISIAARVFDAKNSPEEHPPKESLS